MENKIILLWFSNVCADKSSGPYLEMMTWTVVDPCQADLADFEADPGSCSIC